MGRPTTKKTNTIALETDKFENKIHEFQAYLELNNINRIGEFEDDDRDKHKEIKSQLDIMAALPNLLEALKKLREVDQEKQKELRGNDEVNAAYRILTDKNK